MYKFLVGPTPTLPIQQIFNSTKFLILFIYFVFFYKKIHCAFNLTKAEAGKDTSHLSKDGDSFTSEKITKS